MEAGESAAPQPWDQSCSTIPWLWNQELLGRQICFRSCRLLQPLLSSTEPGSHREEGVGAAWSLLGGWKPPPLQPRLLCPPQGHVMKGCSPCSEPSRAAPVHKPPSWLGNGVIQPWQHPAPQAQAAAVAQVPPIRDTSLRPPEPAAPGFDIPHHGVNAVGRCLPCQQHGWHCPATRLASLSHTPGSFFSPSRIKPQ